MAVPMIIGSETEYGLTVPNDPEFDSIATALLLVNSYNVEQSLKLLWDYDQEDRSRYKSRNHVVFVTFDTKLLHSDCHS